MEGLALVALYNCNVNLFYTDDNDIKSAQSVGLTPIIGGELEILTPYDEEEVSAAINSVAYYILKNELAVFDGLIMENLIRVKDTDTWRELKLKRFDYSHGTYYRLIYPRECFTTDALYQLQFEEIPFNYD